MELASKPVQIARRMSFSSAHFYEQTQFSEAHNRAEFGACFTPNGHGHNYTLEVFIEGPISKSTGLVLDLAKLDAILKHAVAPLDHRHLNFDVPEFKKTDLAHPTHIPTTENIARYLQKRLLSSLQKHPEVRLTKIRLFETEDLWVELLMAPRSPSARAPRSYELTFAATLRGIHNLENPNLSSEENRSLYGVCYRQHGHHYKIQVTVAGEIHPKSGRLMNHQQLERIVRETLIDRFDGTDLNLHFPNTSCEALAQEFYALLSPKFDAGPTPGHCANLLKISIQETRKNFFCFRP